MYTFFLCIFRLFRLPSSCLHFVRCIFTGFTCGESTQRKFWRSHIRREGDPCLWESVVLPSRSYVSHKALSHSSCSKKHARWNQGTAEIMLLLPLVRASWINLYRRLPNLWESTKDGHFRNTPVRNANESKTSQQWVSIRCPNSHKLKADS